MNKALILLLASLSPVAAIASAPAEDSAQQAALTFNRWYMQQINQDKEPVSQGNELGKYVTRETLSKLRDAQKPQNADSQYYDSDFFIKAQDWGDDWVTDITVLYSEYDPVCTNVYLAFGKDKKHIIADCYVKQDGAWKLQSVARGSAGEVTSNK